MRKLIIYFLFAAFLIPATSGWAANFQMDWISINSGGLTEQSSTSYSATITCGQLVAGSSSSSNYQAGLGFLQAIPNIISSLDVREVIADHLPENFELRQNYPNPFNPFTSIEFSVTNYCHVTVKVYNLLGQIVVTLVNEPLNAGTYRATWNGTSESGNQVASGVYFYRLDTEDFMEIRKMVLLK